MLTLHLFYHEMVKIEQIHTCTIENYRFGSERVHCSAFVFSSSPRLVMHECVYVKCADLCEHVNHLSMDCTFNRKWKMHWISNVRFQKHSLWEIQTENRKRKMKSKYNKIKEITTEKSATIVLHLKKFERKKTPRELVQHSAEASDAIEMAVRIEFLATYNASN